MSTTSLGQKILLVVFGCCLTLIALEAFLRFGGFLFSLRQEAANKASFSQGEIRILCIGESTTALGNDNSYPSQLEEILNQRAGVKRFKVINKGLVSKTSQDILGRLNANLERYRPHIVVGMIGINDTKETPGFFSRGAWNRFANQWRVHHLYVLLNQHLHSRWLESRMKANGVQGPTPTSGASAPSADPEAMDEKDYVKIITALRTAETVGVQIEQRLSMGGVDAAQKRDLEEKLSAILAVRARDYRLLGIYHMVRQDYAAAENLLAMAFKLTPNDPAVVFQVGKLFRIQKRSAAALPFLTAAATAFPNSYFAQTELARLYSDLGRKDEARAVFKKALASSDAPVWLYPEVGDWFKTNGYWDEARETLLKAYQNNIFDYTSLDGLAEVYRVIGQKEEAALYARKADELRTRLIGYSSETVENYNAIVRRTRRSGARMVVMQYPIRTLKPLKAIFGDAMDIVFVENRDNFLSALKTGEFSGYFSDNFAGDFGHCTAEGNRLIARHLADVILDEVIPKQK